MSSSHVFDCIWSWKEDIGENAQQIDRPVTSQVMGNFSQFGSGDVQPLLEDFNELSALHDFDLFNTLDWVFDENATSWPDSQ
jgi:hypothetical protein